MNRPEFGRMKLDNFPEDVATKFGLRVKADANGLR